MVASVQSPADIVNLSLARIGYPKRIGNLYDGSAAATKALTLYAQTRDELLRQFDWGFAERSVNLTLLKSAPANGYVPPVYWTPAYPILPWMYEYAYPSDCLKVRSIRATPPILINPDPQANLFSVDNDVALTPPVKVILANVQNAILVYTGQITDPAQWEADFVEALAASLGRRLAPSLVNMDFTKLEVQDEEVAKRIAEAGVG